MKTIRSKIIVLITGITLILCGVLGVLNVMLNTATATDVLKQNMTETAKLAASRIQKELEITKQIAVDTGLDAQLSSAYVTADAKKAIIQQKVKANGYLGGNLIDTTGLIQDGSGTNVSDRDYFKAAMNGQATIYGPVVSRTTGEYSIMIAAPVWQNGTSGTKVTGVVYFKPDVKMLSQIVSKINIGKTGNAYLINKDGLVIAHSDESVVFKKNSITDVKKDASLAKIAQIEQNMVKGGTGYDSYSKNGVTLVQAYAPVSGTEGWSVGVYLQQSEFMGNVSNAIVLTVGVSILFIIIGIVIAVIFTKKVLKPVGVAAAHLSIMAKGEELEALDEKKFKGELAPIAKSYNEVRDTLYRLLSDTGMLADAAIAGNLSVRADVTQHQGGYRQIVEGINKTLDAIVEPVNESAAVLKEMALGNLNVNVQGDYKGDNAVIKDALNETINSMKGYIREISGVLGEVADGNIDVGITSEYKGDFIHLKDSINNIIDSLNSVLSDINTAAEQVASGTRQVSDGSQAISQGATEQASAIEELTASVAEIAEQTKQNAVNASKANEFANAARNDAVAGNEQMKDMQKAMVDINESSANISKIIKVIDDIAFQTNILALNAAVEAARAGVHGKGFAVVAEEVRNLAAKSANAAKETTALIEGSIAKTEAGTKTADITAASLANIVSSVEKAVTLMGAIAAASNDQATGIAQVDRGIGQMSQVVQTNSATSEEAAAAAEELSSQAELLKSSVERFRLKPAGEKAAAVKTTDAHAEAVENKFSAPVKKIDLNDPEFGKY